MAATRNTRSPRCRRCINTTGFAVTVYGHPGNPDFCTYPPANCSHVVYRAMLTDQYGRCMTEELELNNFSSWLTKVRVMP
jgi:hypothetical protein